MTTRLSINRSPAKSVAVMSLSKQIPYNRLLQERGLNLSYEIEGLKIANRRIFFLKNRLTCK